MKFKNAINSIRRKYMQRFVGNIGGNANTNLPLDTCIKRILICRPNHRLGNTLLITPLVQEVVQIFPGCKIDLFTKGTIAPIVFQNYHQVQDIINLPRKHFSDLTSYCSAWLSLRKIGYDLVINVEERSSSGRLATKFARSKYKFFGGGDYNIEVDTDEYQHIAKKPVYDLRHFCGIQNIDRDVELLDLKLSQPEIDAGRSVLNDIIQNNKKTICLFTYATGSKCHSKGWWEEFYNQLRNRYPSYNIIEILPVENVSQLDFKLPTYYSRDIREIASVIANTSLFIGADSGMMHLAASSHCPTMGLFLSSRLEKYKPYGRYDVAVNTNITSIASCVDILKNKFLIAA